MKKGLPDNKGRFGTYGGKFVPETLMSALSELEEVYRVAKKDTKFNTELNCYLTKYAGRPTPLYFAKRLSQKFRKLRIYLKREDLCHTGAHKINNTLGQALLAKRMRKKRIIAETGAGQHGVATATVAAMFGMECVIYMGADDVRRQALNVVRMKLLGAKVIPVASGSRTLKDAINEAMRDWVTNVTTTHYVIGSVVGPHPFPLIVRDFQRVIGKEVRWQIMREEGRLPDAILACVGGGSNSIGIFHEFLNDEKVQLIGIEAGGLGLSTGKHSATLSCGKPGVLHGSMSYLLQDKDGQVLQTHSVSAGLDYPGVGPEHSYLKDSKRALYFSITDREAIAGFKLLAETEGILPALEPAHVIGFLPKLKKKVGKAPPQVVIINLSGRGDKDVQIVKEFLQ